MVTENLPFFPSLSATYVTGFVCTVWELSVEKRTKKHDSYVSMGCFPSCRDNTTHLFFICRLYQQHFISFNDFKNIYKHITIYRPKSSDSVVVLSLCSKSFSQIQIRNSYGKNCHYEVVKEYIFFIGIAASTFPHRNLSLSFVKLPSKKFLNLLGAFIMKLWRHIII